MRCRRRKQLPVVVGAFHLDVHYLATVREHLVDGLLEGVEPTGVLRIVETDPIVGNARLDLFAEVGRIRELALGRGCHHPETIVPSSSRTGRSSERSRRGPARAGPRASAVSDPDSYTSRGYTQRRGSGSRRYRVCRPRRRSRSTATRAASSADWCLRADRMPFLTQSLEVGEFALSVHCSRRFHGTPSSPSTNARSDLGVDALMIV